MTKTYDKEQGATGSRRKYMQVYFEWFDSIITLSDEDKNEMLLAMKQYGLDGTQPVFKSSVNQTLWAIFAPKIEEERCKYIASCIARKNNGLLGGRPKTKKNLEKPTRFIENLEKPDIERELEDIDIKENTKETPEAFSLTSLPPPALSFKQWTEQQFIEEVQKHPEYADIAEEFIDHYTETNDKGKMLFQTMKSWETKRRLARWRKNDYSHRQGGFNAQTPQTVPTINTFTAF